MNTIRKSLTFFCFIGLIFVFSCIQNKEDENDVTSWKFAIQQELPLLGHRNWIMIVDKAFPQQTAEGVKMIYTGEKLIPVLEYAIGQIEKSNHLNPVFYTDKELWYLTDSLSPGVESFRNSLSELLPVKASKILHDSVFARIGRTSELFSILVLKTDEVIPYTSVFIQLDCKYWTHEEKLRDIMEK